MRQKHLALFEHFSGIFPKIIFLFRETKEAIIFLRENEDLNSKVTKAANATLIELMRGD